MDKIKDRAVRLGVIEGLLIMVIVAMIGFIGWYVWHINQSAKANLAVTTSSSAPSFRPKKQTPSSKPLTAAQAVPTTQGAVTIYHSWSTTPQDIQQAVLTAWQPTLEAIKHNPIPDCTSNAPEQHVDSGSSVYAENDAFVVTGAGCDGGAIHLVVKIKGAWQDVASTQFDLSCAVLTQYNVPNDLLVAAFTGSTDGNPVQCRQADNSVRNLN